jgi:hypothetical protein
MNRFAACSDPRAETGPRIAKMTKDEMVEWFKSAPMGLRHQRMLWAACKIAHLTGVTLSDAVACPDRGRERGRRMNTWTCSVSRDDKRADRSATSVVQKIALTASSLGRIIQSRDRSCVDPWPSRREIYGKQPARQPAYKRLSARVDRLEDAISHFYNVTNELHRRVSTLEKKSKPLAKR